jgi:hypothetical protein
MDRMDRQQVHETINQLVETYHDQPQARDRLSHLTTSNQPTREPDKFPDLPAFLAFHDERQRYEDRLQSLRTEVANLDKAHKEAERTLRGILPANVPLYYHYDGDRQDLAGVQFKIVNQHRTIIISSSGSPGQGPVET